MKIKLSILSVVILLSAVCYCAVDTVSLQYIMQEKFDGRDLQIGKTLADNDVYTRYYVTYMSGKLKNIRHHECSKSAGPHPVIIQLMVSSNKILYERQRAEAGAGLSRTQRICCHPSGLPKQ